MEYWIWKANIYITLLDNWLGILLRRDISKSQHYFRIMEKIFREINSDIVMAMELGCNWVLLSPQRFKWWFGTILVITYFGLFSLDKPRQAEIILNLPLASFGGTSTIIYLKSSNNFPYSLLKFSASLSEDYDWVYYC